MTTRKTKAVTKQYTKDSREEVDIDARGKFVRGQINEECFVTILAFLHGNVNG
jgi:hypothetical protein